MKLVAVIQTHIGHSYFAKFRKLLYHPKETIPSTSTEQKHFSLEPKWKHQLK